MTTDADAPYNFGPFWLDPAEKTLTSAGEPVALTPKVFDTLLALVSHTGRLLSKDDLMKEVWPNTFVEEANLAQNISVLRKILGDGAESRYIETVPKRGYRFVAPVTRGRPNPAAVATLPPRRSTVPRLAVAAITGATLAIIVLLAWVARPVERENTRAILAVLPIANITGDPDDEYLSDGLTEELVTQVGRLHPPRLAVLGRVTVARYLANGHTAADIGTVLGVRYVIEGSVRREGSRVRVSVRLLETPGQTLLWADSYEQDMGEALPMQIRVSRAVTSRLQTTLSLPSERLVIRGGTENPQAFELYLKAHFLWNKRMPDMQLKALRLYEQAVALDPTFAQAYAEMSQVHVAVPNPTSIDGYQLALEAASKALAIDDGLVAAHISLAAAAMHLFDWPTAERALRRAEELDPTFRSTEFMLIRGQADDALAESERALENDPLNMLAWHAAGFHAFYARQYTKAIGHFLQAIELDPSHVYSRIRLADCYAALGRYDEAIPIWQEAGSVALGNLGLAYGLLNRRQDALDVLRQLHEQSPTHLALGKAGVYIGLGDLDSAFYWMNKAYDERSFQLIYLKVDPRLDPLRADPRYEELVRRAGFPAL